MMKFKKMMMVSSCLLVLAACTKDDDHENSGATAKQTESSFTMMDTNGNEHKLSDYKGKKVYIKLWASWCPICLSGLDELDILKETTKDFEVLTIAAPNYKNEKNKEDFISWFASLNYKNIQVLLDEDGSYMQEIGVKGYPTSVFIDEAGDVKKVKPGHLNNEQINEVMASL